MAGECGLGVEEDELGGAKCGEVERRHFALM